MDRYKHIKIQAHENIPFYNQQRGDGWERESTSNDGQHHVDDILAAAAFQDNMTRLLAAVIKAIFTVYGIPDTAVQQYPLSLKKWHKLIVGPRQIVLGLVVDTNKMTVGITNEYIKKIQVLLGLWDPNKRFFKVNDMQS